MSNDIIASMPRPAKFKITTSGGWPQLRTWAIPLDVVLRNLIENAIKHHDRDEGHITVTANETETAVQFSISDDGPGIPKDWHAAIFEPFRRITDAADEQSRDADSSGIGLALVKRTVETVAGRVDVQSNPAVSRGTTFRVTWPRTAPAS